jgi:hypothetical protein
MKTAILNSTLKIQDWFECVNPDLVQITLSNGKKLEIKKKRVPGGTAFYQTILSCLDNYDTNERAKSFMDKLIDAMIKSM